MQVDFNWYVVRTKPHGEYKADRELSNQGYQAFLPVIGHRRLVKGRECVSNEPLFPGYLFIRLSLVDSCWYRIRYTRGVTGLVTFGNSDPLSVSDDVVHSIKKGCRERPIKPLLEPGNQVNVLPAQMDRVGESAIWGRLESLDGEGRSVVLMSLLGRRHKIRVSTDRLTLR